MRLRGRVLEEPGLGALLVCPGPNVSGPKSGAGHGLEQLVWSERLPRSDVAPGSAEMARTGTSGRKAASTSRDFSMPSATIATGHVDAVLAVEDIAVALVSLALTGSVQR